MVCAFLKNFKLEHEVCTINFEKGQIGHLNKTHHFFAVEGI
jgi:hypothetical protein